MITYHNCFFLVVSALTAISHNSQWTVNAFSGSPGRRLHLRYQGGRRASIPRMSKEDNEGDYNPRNNLGRALANFQSSALRNSMTPGDTVVCKRAVPSLNIFENEGYELVEVYAQSFSDETQSVEKISLTDMEAPVPNGWDCYITLYSPVHHDAPVVVTPQEVGLASVRSELIDAAWLAVPGFFWVFVAASFYNTYYERTGASFADAFWGR